MNKRRQRTHSRLSGGKRKCSFYFVSNYKPFAIIKLKMEIFKFGLPLIGEKNRYSFRKLEIEF